MRARIPIILVDTRERSPFEFRGRAVKVRRVALKSGDYKCGRVLIERKSVSDLFHTLTRGEERFKRELQRLQKASVCAYVVIEGSIEAVKRGTWSSAAYGPRIVDSALGLCVSYGISIAFCNGRADAEEFSYRLLCAGFRRSS